MQEKPASFKSTRGSCRLEKMASRGAHMSAAGSLHKRPADRALRGDAHSHAAGAAAHEELTARSAAHVARCFHGASLLAKRAAQCSLLCSLVSPM